MTYATLDIDALRDHRQHDRGLGLQLAIDPDFDLDAALAAAEEIITRGLPRPSGENEAG